MIRRYDLEGISSGMSVYYEMIERKEGDWVKFSDYSELVTLIRILYDNCNAALEKKTYVFEPEDMLEALLSMPDTIDTLSSENKELYEELENKSSEIYDLEHEIKTLTNRIAQLEDK